MMSKPSNTAAKQRLDYFWLYRSGKLWLSRRKKWTLRMINLGRIEQRLDLARLRVYAMVSVALFAFGAIAGGLAIVFYPNVALLLQDLLRQFANMFRGMPKFQLAIAIFFNNSVKTLVVVLAGPLFGIVPVLFLLFNGTMLGAVVPLSVQSKGLWSSIMAIAPHGIFELPAIFLGSSIGIRLGLYFFRRLRDASLFAEFRYGIRVYVTIIIPLLLVAALIEVFVTPLIAGL